MFCIFTPIKTWCRIALNKENKGKNNKVKKNKNDKNVKNMQKRNKDKKTKGESWKWKEIAKQEENQEKKEESH